MGIAPTTITLYYDNRSAIQIAHNDVFHECTKYIENDSICASTCCSRHYPPALFLLQISSTKLTYLAVSLISFLNLSWSLLYHLEFERAVSIILQNILCCRIYYDIFYNIIFPFLVTVINFHIVG